MLVAFAGDHPFAQQHLRALHGALLNEIVVLHHQYFTDVVGMIQKDDVVATDLVVGDVAVFVGKVLKQKDRIRRAKLAQREPEKVPLEARSAYGFWATAFCSRSNSASTSAL